MTDAPKPLSADELNTLYLLADAAVPNYLMWEVLDTSAWAIPNVRIVANRKDGDSITIVRFLNGEPQFWCTIGKKEYEDANAAYIAAANPFIMKRIEATIDDLKRQIAELEKAREWQPIETAPKDGKTRVDLYGTANGTPEQFDNAIWAPHDLYGGPMCEEMWVWPSRNDRNTYTYTHFRYRPEPP